MPLIYLSIFVGDVSIITSPQNHIISYTYYFLFMRDETPNERNYRLLKERFLYDDRIVYDDGKSQFTLEMLKEKHLIIDRQIGYHSARYLVGNEAILYLLKSPSNRIRNEISPLIYKLEMQIKEQYRLLTPKEIEEQEKKYPLFPKEIENENEPANENEPQFTIETVFGKEQPFEMKFIDENGNEKVRRIERIIGNGIENRIIFVDENENELGNELGFGNGNENQNGNGNELKNENENELFDKLRTIKEHIKNIL